jgi:formylglycine-generating enzyme required for sulfatase activity
MQEVKKIWIAAGLSVILLAAVYSFSKGPNQSISEMVVVPSGSFLMGVDRSPADDEGPQHEVNLDTYWIDRYEVSNAEYRRCVEAGGCQEPKDLRFFNDPIFANHPVVYVTWYNAGDYCRWLGKRLPAEVEWEKAARGAQGWLYPWGDQLVRNWLNADNRIGSTQPVGSYPQGASPYGALDMAGNVWEWVDDWYQSYPGSTFQSDLFGIKYKVVRGGSWNHPAEDARSDHRDIAHPERAMGVVGFRCARGY